MNEEFLTELGISQELGAQIIAQHEREMEQMQISHELEQEFAASCVQDEAAVRALLAGAELKPGGIRETLAGIKAEHPALFGAAKAPRIVSSANADNASKRDEFRKMGYQERLKLFREQPDLYNKFI